MGTELIWKQALGCSESALAASALVPLPTSIHALTKPDDINRIVVVKCILSGLNWITSARLLAIRHQYNDASASDILELVEVRACLIQGPPDGGVIASGRIADSE